MYEFEVQGNYGHGWECVTTEATSKEALQRLHEYRANEPGTPFRVKRVKVSDQQQDHDQELAGIRSIADLI